MPAVSAFCLCGLLGSAGVGYVWQQNQLYQLGIEIRTAEAKIEKLRRQNKTLADRLAAMSSPKELDARIKKLNLGLLQPQQDQILRLVEVAPEPARASQSAVASKKLAMSTGSRR
jgi:hypothetical protein